MKKFVSGFLIVLLIVVTFGCAALFVKAYQKEKEDSVVKCEHKYLEGSLVKEATCTEPGEMVFACTECGEAKTEEIPMIAHDLKYTATDETSHNEYCTRCGIERKVSNADAVVARWVYNEDTHYGECECGAIVVTETDHVLKDEYIYSYNAHGDYEASCICGKIMQTFDLTNEKVTTINLNIATIDAETEATFGMLEVINPDLLSTDGLVLNTVDGEPSFLEYKGQNVMEYMCGVDENEAPVFSAKLFQNNLGAQHLDFLVVTPDGVLHKIPLDVFVIMNDGVALE